MKGDIQDFKKLLQASESVNAIIHLVAIVSVPKSIENPTETNSVTLGGTINVFEVAKKLKIKKVVQASSAAVYSLVSPYAISKYTSELYAKSYFDLYEINSVSLRFFNVYGERQPADSPYSGVVAKFVDVFKKKDKGTLKTEQKDRKSVV